MIKATNQSYYEIYEKASFELHSRYMAFYINNNGYDCTHYVNLAIQNFESADVICNDYDFTQLDAVQYFARVLWFGEPYRS